MSSSGATGRERDPRLRERYGLGKAREGATGFRKVTSARWFIPALLSAVIGGSWLAWSAMHYSLPEIRHSLISFSVVDSRNIDIRYSVTFKSSTKRHLCQLVAKDYLANTVGEVTEHFPAGTRARTLITRIPTRVAAVNADIARCAVE